jgi:hypothetical protein
VDPILAVIDATIRAGLRERHTQGLTLACFDSDGWDVSERKTGIPLQVG